MPSLFYGGINSLPSLVFRLIHLTMKQAERTIFTSDSQMRQIMTE